MGQSASKPLDKHSFVSDFAIWTNSKSPINLFFRNQSDSMIQSPYPGFASNYSTHGSLNKQGIYKATDRSYKSYSAFKILGRGSFGLVYLATTSENKRVAVKSKLYLNDFNLMNKSIQFFRGELEALFNMKHPNIIRLLGVEFESNEVSSLILEYVEGETLDKYIHKHQALSEKSIKLFTRQIVEAVAHMHAKLVMHRDIKSSNVMVVNERWIKVIDFGMAKRLNMDDMGLNMSTSTIVGTVRTRRALRYFLFRYDSFVVCLWRYKGALHGA